jgi:hypothetical protein
MLVNWEKLLRVISAKTTSRNQPSLCSHETNLSALAGSSPSLGLVTNASALRLRILGFPLGSFSISNRTAPVQVRLGSKARHSINSLRGQDIFVDQPLNDWDIAQAQAP